jgi:class 3 adenylate cyclase
MESSSRTLVCSVLFLDIVEYSKKAVVDQLQLKQAFNDVLGKSLDGVPQRDRIILDTGDGAAVTFMGDPEDALFAAMSARDYSGGLPIRMGVNLGPVRLVKDLNGQMNIIGDGINVAQRVMSFARPGQLLVSRSFYEVVSCLSRDYLNLFRHEGSRTDKHVREHEVYSVVGGVPNAHRVSESASQVSGDSTIIGWVSGVGPLGVRRSALIAAPALFAAIVGGALALSAMLESAPASAGTAPAAAAALAPAAAPARPEAAPPKVAAATTPPAAPAAAPAASAADEKAPPAPKKKLLARAEKKPFEKKAGKGFGRVEFTVAPWGTVFVDGLDRGASPPLRALDLPPGPHTILIRNGEFPPYTERVVIKSGEATKIRHQFR